MKFSETDESVQRINKPWLLWTASPTEVTWRGGESIRPPAASLQCDLKRFAEEIWYFGWVCWVSLPSSQRSFSGTPTFLFPQKRTLPNWNWATDIVGGCTTAKSLLKRYTWKWIEFFFCSFFFFFSFYIPSRLTLACEVGPWFQVPWFSRFLL